MNRIFIAAPKSGSGKTSITIALLETLKRRGVKCVSFKCGPDYIDPLFHQKVLGIPSYNLDTFFTSADVTKDLYLDHCRGFDAAVTEGVMGIFDGAGGMGEEGSSYDLASVTGDNIILVIEAKGACRSLIPLISGFISYDHKKLIKGVILNRCSKGVYEKLEPEILKLGIRPFGFLRNNKDLILPSRHLGLTLPSEIECIREVIDSLCLEFNENVKVDELLELTKDDSIVEKISSSGYLNNKNPQEDSAIESPCTIAVARDDAFCFLYEDNLNLLKRFGAKIIFFSPISDEKIPGDADALYFPGGYPELFLEKLSINTSMKSSIKKAYDDGIPVFAECGGFMYLHDAITDAEGRRFETVGIVDSECEYTGRSVRFGYMSLCEKRPFFLGEGEIIKGHEFHYWDTKSVNDSCIASKPFTDNKYDCVIVNDHSWMGFPHLYFPSNPHFAKKFVEMAKSFRSEKINQ